MLLLSLTDVNPGGTRGHLIILCVGGGGIVPQVQLSQAGAEEVDAFGEIHVWSFCFQIDIMHVTDEFLNFKCKFYKWEQLRLRICQRQWCLNAF